MLKRSILFLTAITLGVAVSAVAPSVPQLLRSTVFSGLPSLRETVEKTEASDGGSKSGSQPADHPEKDHEYGEGVITLSPEQIAEGGLETIEASADVLATRLTVPGSISPDSDRIARVAVRLTGTVAELRKRLGDWVDKGEVVAVLESRDVADAKSEYLAARSTDELQQTLSERERMLWDKRISPEQQYLKARAASRETRIRLDQARQKLFALGLSEGEIADLPQQPIANLRRQEIRSPGAGRVVERRVDVGSAVGRDNLETDLFVIVDVSEVWVDLAVAPADLSLMKEGQKIEIAGTANQRATAEIIFVGPLLDKETRSARVVARLENRSGLWRPGAFITAGILIDEQTVAVAIPKSAVQTIEGKPVVFVRTGKGFLKRAVTLGLQDEKSVEIVAGLQAGEPVAAANTFTLKAELGKAEAGQQND